MKNNLLKSGIFFYFFRMPIKFNYVSESYLAQTEVSVKWNIIYNMFYHTKEVLVYTINFVWMQDVVKFEETIYKELLLH